MKYALIGKKLVHSFSKDIHTEAGLNYDLVELAEEEVVPFVKSNSYDGFNVTIPYKEVVFNAVDVVDDSAKFIGSVNTVLRKNGKTYGYNTDVGGMRYILKKAGGVKGKTVLILGSGGTSKTAQALCKIDGAKKFYVCSRKGEINYDNVYSLAADAEIVINCTPVGMFPNCGERVLKVSEFKNLKFVADCVYNPLKTALILDAEKEKIAFSDGLSMLVAQAVYAEEIWLNGKLDENIIAEISAKLSKEKSSIVLVGMPGCGKSTVGKAVAERTGKRFFDSDEEIEKKYAHPSKIIEEKGEAEFRKAESETIAELTLEGGKVIATGGGAILSEKNRDCLRQNGIVVYLKRDLDKLPSDGRPLSKAKGAEKLFAERKDIYESVCDVAVDNNDQPEKAVEEIIKFYENLGY